MTNSKKSQLFYKCLRVSSFISLTFFCSIYAHAFWPFSKEESEAFPTPRQYNYQACQFAHDEKKDPYGEADINRDFKGNCHPRSGVPHVSSQIDQLQESSDQITRHLGQQAILDDLKTFVEQKIESNFKQIDDMIQCLENRENNLSLECYRMIESLRLSTLNGLPLMREHMALMQGPESGSYYHIPRYTNPRENPEYNYTFNIKHEYVDREIPPLNQNERKNLDIIYESFSHEYEQNWMRTMGRRSCFQQDPETNLYQPANERCARTYKPLIDRAVRHEFEKNRSQHKQEYLDLLSIAPYLAYVQLDDPAPEVDENNELDYERLDQALLEGIKAMREDIQNDLKKVNLGSNRSIRSLFRYPSLIESFLESQDPLSDVHCNIAEFMNTRYGPGGRIDLMTDIGVAVAAIAGGIGCIFTGGIGCAIGVAIGAEVYFLGKTSHRLYQSQNLHGGGLITAQELESSRTDRNISLLFAPLAFTGIHGGQVIARGASTSRNVRPEQAIQQGRGPRLLSREADTLRSHYLHYSPTSTAQNRQWIEVARNNRATHYFDVENAAIKRLNDTIGDKNLVTSLTNLHKQILFDKIDDLQRQFPGLEIHRYSDFKSSRFAFSGDVPPDIQVRLNRIFHETGLEFEDVVGRANFSNIPESEVPGLWFNAGLGNTADQAGLAARQARDLTRDTAQRRASGDHIVSYTQVHDQLQNHLRSVESQRLALYNAIGPDGPNRNIIFDSSSGSPIPRQEVFEILRKSAGKSSEQLAQTFNSQLRANISPQQAKDLSEYARHIDQFSPGLWNEGRVVANLDEAIHGGLSADFKGMGARNLYQVARDLADHPQNLDSAIDAVRRGEGSVTDSFNRQKSEFTDLVDQTLHRFNIRQTARCSGDDCVSLAQSPLSRDAQDAIVQSIARSSKPNAYRLSFIPPGVRPQDRTMLAVHGELIEKSIRQNAIGLGPNQLPPEVLSRLQIAVEMPPTLGSGNVRLIIGHSPDIELTPSQRRIIERQFESSLGRANQDISRESNRAINYTHSNIRFTSP